MYDLLIKNGTIIDGTGAPRFKGDVAIKDGVIADIGRLSEAEAKRVIDAKGLMVAPGFIDAHSHSDVGVFYPGMTGYNHLEDGTTTELAGQCGTSAAPYYGEFTPIAGMSEEEYKEICSSFSSYIRYVEGLSLGNNLAFFVGQGNIRGKVMGLGEGVPDERQLEQMRQIMAEAMECGCLGFSTGLVYTPSVFAGTEEIVEIAKTAHRYGGVYTSHIRGEGIHLMEAVEEALEIGRRSGIPVNISHIKVKGRESQAAQLIKYIEDNKKAGMKITADQYPYIGSSAPLVSQIPPKYLTEGRLAGVRALRDPELRKKALYSIFHETDEFESNIYSAGFEGCIISGAANTPQYIGKSLAQIAAEEGKEPFDVCMDILDANDAVVQGIYFCINEGDMLELMGQPWVMAGSDSSHYGPPIDPEKQAGGHPRSMSTMVKRLQLIRDNGLWTLEDAIYRMTGMTADTYGLPMIGRLKKGLNADVTIFDYERLEGKASYVRPFRKNTGIEYVIVNGRVAVENGVFTGEKNGKVLKMKR